MSLKLKKLFTFKMYELNDYSSSISPEHDALSVFIPKEIDEDSNFNTYELFKFILNKIQDHIESNKDLEFLDSKKIPILQALTNLLDFNNMKFQINETYEVNEMRYFKLTEHKSVLIEMRIKRDYFLVITNEEEVKK